MAQYKLMQDIEAEDHILGPLTFRQFVFALIFVFCAYMCFVAITRHIYVLLGPFAPVGLFFGFFAIPFGRDQPTEVWFLAKLRFWFKPRKRIWDQSGVKELVTVTAPKKIERVLTNGLSQNEVRSRLSALANTLDSRGWAVKGIAVNAYANPDPVMGMSSDRLIDINSMPQEVPSYDVHAGDDIFEEATNPVAQQFSEMIAQSEQQHRQQLMNQMKSAQPPASATPPPSSKSSSYWFTSQGGDPVEAAVTNPQQAAPVDQGMSREEEQRLAEELKARHDPQPEAYSHLRTLRPVGNSNSPTMQAPVQPPEPPSPPAPDPAILSLASNNDLNVATIAREAHKARHDDKPSQDEVVISLR